MIDDINADLQRSFIKAKVEEAVHQMTPLKSPNLDWYVTCFFFFQDHWDIVGDEVREAILNFLRGKDWITPSILHI